MAVVTLDSYESVARIVRKMLKLSSDGGSCGSVKYKGDYGGALVGPAGVCVAGVSSLESDGQRLVGIWLQSA